MTQEQQDINEIVRDWTNGNRKHAREILSSYPSVQAAYMTAAAIAENSSVREDMPSFLRMLDYRS